MLCHMDVAHHCTVNLSIRFYPPCSLRISWARRVYEPILQMYNPLNSNLRDVLNVEDNVCNYSQAE